VSLGSCREGCQGRCGRSKKIEYCQGLRSRDSRGDPALELAVFECMRFEWVETKRRDRLPAESLGKRTQQHLCPLILDHHAALGDYSTDMVVRAKERLQGLSIISTSELGAEILEITTCEDDLPGSTVGQPKRVQHLRPEYSPILFHVSAHHDNRVSNIRAFHRVVREHRNGIEAGRVGPGEGGEALVLVVERHHIRATKDRRAWTIRKWHLIPLCAGSRDGLNK